MAAITAVAPILCSLPGQEDVFYAYAATAIDAGDPVIITATATPSTRWDMTVTKAVAAVAHGVALKTVAAGGTAEVAWRGEMDGFSGLTPGAPLTVAAGEIDNVAPAVGVSTTIRAVTASRIRFDLV